MNCYFDEKGNPKIRLFVKSDEEEVEVEALIDTGFNGQIMLSLPVAMQLKLKLLSSVTITLADGSVKNKLLFEGKAKLDKVYSPVEIILTEEGDDKIGVGLLKNSKLIMDFTKKKILIK